MKSIFNVHDRVILSLKQEQEVMDVKLTTISEQVVS